MIVLIYGGSGSGKSSYAEKRIKELSGLMCQKYYLATMIIYDAEGEKKVRRHRQLREKDDYITIEQPDNIGKALEKINKNRKSAVLLEDIGNLAANEMFGKAVVTDIKQVSKKVTEEIEALAKNVDILVIVSNNVFDDGACYDEVTKEYMRCLADINKKLMEISNQAVEVVAGIPLVIKTDERNTYN